MNTLKIVEEPNVFDLRQVLLNPDATTTVRPLISWINGDAELITDIPDCYESKRCQKREMYNNSDALVVVNFRHYQTK